MTPRAIGATAGSVSQSDNSDPVSRVHVAKPYSPVQLANVRSRVCRTDPCSPVHCAKLCPQVD